MTKQVAFEPVNGPINDRIDDAYRAKYRDRAAVFLGVALAMSARNTTPAQCGCAA